MATAPVSRRLNLTRDQLAAFLTDQQQIRQFELLFAVVDELQVITGTDFEYQADTAAATANEALAQIAALAQDTAVDDAVLNAKVQEALDTIPRLAQALELLALAPRQELGTIASQNADNVNITGGLISGLDAPLPVASGGIGVTTASANQVFAGPTSGAAAVPAFRALVAADIPALPYGTGDVVGPASATDNAIARFDLTTGKLIQNSGVTIDDNANLESVRSVKFSGLTPAATPAGTLWFDTTTGSYNAIMGGGNITQQVGEEIFVYGKASATISDSPLQIVRKTGVVGASGVITFGPTVASITDPGVIIGVATEPIANNSFGRVTAFGVVRGITTNGAAYGEVWADNDDIWYNPVTGNPTKIEPTAPGIKVRIGTIINAGAGGSGSFQVLLLPGSTLGGTDSNVQFGTIATNDLIQYNGTIWTNVTPASVINSAGGAPVTKTANFSVSAGETWLINNKSGSSCTVTLPTASANTGRVLHFQNYQAQTLVSASSNVVPLVGGSATTAILEAVAGANATLVSDGTNWIMTQYDSNNALQLE
jgi:hypothetical protein